MPVTSHRGLVAAGTSAVEERALADPLHRRARVVRPACSCSGASVRWTSASSGATSTMPAADAPASGRALEPLRRLVVLGERPLERQRRALGQRPHVVAAHPGREVVGEAVRLLVGARHDDERVAGRQRGAARGQVRRARGGGHAKDARFRQMGPEGVDERCDAAVAAA